MAHCHIRHLFFSFTYVFRNRALHRRWRSCSSARGWFTGRCLCSLTTPWVELALSICSSKTSAYLTLSFSLCSLNRLVLLFCFVSTYHVLTCYCFRYLNCIQTQVPMCCVTSLRPLSQTSDDVVVLNDWSMLFASMLFACWLLLLLVCLLMCKLNRTQDNWRFVCVSQTQERYSYADPVTEFVECLYVHFDFEAAQKKLKECEEYTCCSLSFLFCLCLWSMIEFLSQQFELCAESC